MNEDSSAISIDYYTDVLCIWAWIAQPRLEELRKQWGRKIKIHHRYIDIFGDAKTKIPTQWGETDGYEKFHQHVAHSAEPYEHTHIHKDIWTAVRPQSSATAHLILKAIEIVAGEAQVDAMSTAIRREFFTLATDISDMETLLDLSTGLEINRDDLLKSLSNGSAMAALSADYKSVKENAVKGSPSWVLNSGRQTLYGNVGYRILSSNIEELLKSPTEEASWC